MLAYTMRCVAKCQSRFDAKKSETNMPQRHSLVDSYAVIMKSMRYSSSLALRLLSIRNMSFGSAVSIHSTPNQSRKGSRLTDGSTNVSSGSSAHS